jgi:hypothetical protein
MFCISSPFVDDPLPQAGGGSTHYFRAVGCVVWGSLEGSSWQSWLMTQLVTCLVKDIGASSDTRNGEYHERQNDKHANHDADRVVT